MRVNKSEHGNKDRHGKANAGQQADKHHTVPVKLGWQSAQAEFNRQKASRQHAKRLADEQTAPDAKQNRPCPFNGKINIGQTYARIGKGKDGHHTKTDPGLQYQWHSDDRRNQIALPLMDLPQQVFFFSFSLINLTTAMLRVARESQGIGGGSGKSNRRLTASKNKPACNVQ